MTQFLLSTCAVCAVGQLARANTNQPEPTPAQQTPPSSPQSPTPATPPPVPTDTPAGTSPADPTSTSPSDPSNGPYNSPTTPTDRPTDTAPGTTSLPPSAPDTSGSAGVSGGASVQSGATVNGGAGVHGGVSAGAGATIQGGATVQGGAAVEGGATVIAPVVETDDSDPYSYAWREPGLESGIGVSTIIGGGVTGFTDKTMRNTTSDVGGLWDFRLTIGSHVPIALDLSYVGSATHINGLPTGRKGTLVGTTAEAALRYNMLPHLPWTPYIFAGVGWQRYDVTQTTVSLSDSGMNDHDNLLEFPVGGGLAYRMAGFVFDLRGTFRATTDQDLVLTRPVLASSPTSDDFAAMHTWEASAALGYEF